MEFDKNENGQKIQEKMSDKNTDPCKESIEDMDRSSPKVEGSRGTYEEDNALYDYSDDFEDVDDNAEAPTKEHILSCGHPSDLNLPSTVTVLDTDWGSRVYLVGTCHFSLESQEDVAKTIKATQPNVVVVELCVRRISVLLLDERTLFEEETKINFETIKGIIKQDGFVHGLMKILFLRRNAHRAKELGMAGGGEFRRAANEALLVPHCKVHLGDRLTHITFKRCLHLLSFFEKLKLAWYLIATKGLSHKDVEMCKQKDVMKEILTKMRRKYPDFTRVFIEEKDIFLANSLKYAAQPIHLSTGHLMPTVVVGVVGMAHVPGIEDVWKQNEYDIRSIITVPEKSLIRKFWGISIGAGYIGLALYGCFQLYKLTRSRLFHRLWLPRMY